MSASTSMGRSSDEDRRDAMMVCQLQGDIDDLSLVCEAIKGLEETDERYCALLAKHGDENGQAVRLAPIPKPPEAQMLRCLLRDQPSQFCVFLFHGASHSRRRPCPVAEFVAVVRLSNHPAVENFRFPEVP